MGYKTVLKTIYVALCMTWNESKKIWTILQNFEINLKEAQAFPNDSLIIISMFSWVRTPTNPPITSPSLTSFTQGIAETSNSWAISPNSSTSTNNRFIWSLWFSTTFLSVGVSTLHGPHQPAWKSMRVGISSWNTWRSKKEDLNMWYLYEILKKWSFNDHFNSSPRCRASKMITFNWHNIDLHLTFTLCRFIWNDVYLLVPSLAQVTANPQCKSSIIHSHIESLGHQF